jgi:antitoxin (DNA-binding transcriptional repressor) of toxin-antitoxin stability system
MQQLNASKVKEQCLSLLDHLDPDGIVITKHGKPVARLIPIESACADLIGSMKGKVKVTGDIFSTGIKWDAES